MYRISVPATSANIGPGFDCLGIALKLYNTIEFCISEELNITAQGRYANGIKLDTDNLFYKSYCHAMQSMGKAPVPLRVKQECIIPTSRGLGSSATAVVSGVLAANQVLGADWSREHMLVLAAAIEGHADNVAPAIYGGFCAVLADHNKCVSITPPDDLVVIVLIPDFELSTRTARMVLPENIPHKDAVYNIANVAFLTAALAKGDIEQIKYSLCDKLHQPYRAGLIENFYDILSLCQDSGALGAYLSGAGSAIAAFAKKETAAELSAKLKNSKLLRNWEILVLDIDTEGASVVSE